MKLKDRILTERISNLEQLSPGERAQALADPGLTELIEGNAALTGISESKPPAPPWENLRASVIQQAAEQKEKPMNLLSRLFHGKRWYVQAALGFMVVVAVFALSLFLPHDSETLIAPAWAQTDGYMLSYTFDGIDPETCCELPMFKEFGAALKAWSEKAKESAEGEIRILQKIEVRKDAPEAPATVVLTVLAAGLDAEQVDSLRDTLAGVPGIPDPSVDEATWFYDDKEISPDFISISLGDRTFNFPKETSKEEIEATIQQWIDEKDPGANVEVEIENVGEEMRIKIMVKPSEDN